VGMQETDAMSFVMLNVHNTSHPEQCCVLSAGYVWSLQIRLNKPAMNSPNTSEMSIFASKCVFISMFLF
jgi:hypothetical protein